MYGIPYKRVKTASAAPKPDSWLVVECTPTEVVHPGKSHRIAHELSERRALPRAARREVCVDLGIKQSFTRAYRPQTNGAAEPFIQSSLREWADE